MKKNKRELKKRINEICDNLLAETVAVSLYVGKPHEDDVKSLLASILHVRNNYINRVSHPEPGMSKKDYFKNLKEGVKNDVEEIIDHISNLS